MASKFFKAFSFFKKKGTASPTITQPRQLKTTMKRIQSENKRFGFTKAKTATDRANIVRRKKSIERMEKLDAAKKKVKAGEKGKKDIQKMVDTGQADRVGSSVYHRGIRDKKMFGGLMGKKKEKDKPEKPRDKRKPIDPINQKKLEEKFRKKVREQENRREPARKDSLREKIKPKKKMDRLKQLREELK